MQVPAEGVCMSAFMSSISKTHAAFGAPWLSMYPNDVLERHRSILLRDLTRRPANPESVTMSKYLTNVRYTVAVDVHYPFLLEPFALLDEREEPGGEGHPSIHPLNNNTSFCAATQAVYSSTQSIAVRRQVSLFMTMAHTAGGGCGISISLLGH